MRKIDRYPQRLFDFLGVGEFASPVKRDALDRDSGRFQHRDHSTAYGSCLFIWNFHTQRIAAFPVSLRDSGQTESTYACCISEHQAVLIQCYATGKP